MNEYLTSKFRAAVGRGEVSIVKDLLETNPTKRKALVDHVNDEGWSILAWAAWTGQVAIVKTLLDFGASDKSISKDRNLEDELKVRMLEAHKRDSGISKTLNLLQPNQEDYKAIMALLGVEE